MISLNRSCTSQMKNEVFEGTRRGTLCIIANIKKNNKKIKIIKNNILFFKITNYSNNTS